MLVERLPLVGEVLVSGLRGLNGGPLSARELHVEVVPQAGAPLVLSPPQARLLHERLDGDPRNAILLAGFVHGAPEELTVRRTASVARFAGLLRLGAAVAAALNELRLGRRDVWIGANAASGPVSGAAVSPVPAVRSVPSAVPIFWHSLLPQGSIACDVSASIPKSRTIVATPKMSATTVET